MKKQHFLLVIVLVILVTAVILRLSGPEDAWLCRDGEWTKHGQPSAPAPTTTCDLMGSQAGSNLSAVDAHGCQTDAGYFWCDLKSRCLHPDLERCVQADNKVDEVIGEVVIFVPAPGEKISSPLTVKGQARGNWFFEANLPVKLVDINNQTIAAHYGTAEGDWMTTEFVPFTAVLEFSATTSKTGFLIVSKDNPSGLPVNDASLSWPVEFE